MSDRNCWGTPPDLFAELHAKYNFTVDACALSWNTKLPRYWTPPGETHWRLNIPPTGFDGLAQDWAGERVWCNPPYGRGLIEPWVEKALERTPGTRYELLGPYKADLVALLLPARTDTAWFHKLYDAPGVDIDFLPKRIRFVPPPGVKASSPTEASILAVIR